MIRGQTWISDIAVIIFFIQSSLEQRLKKAIIAAQKMDVYRRQNTMLSIFPLLITDALPMNEIHLYAELDDKSIFTVC